MILFIHIFSFSSFIKVVLGKEIVRNTQMDQKLVHELLDIGQKLKDLGETSIEDVISGRTLCAHDFYEGKKEAII